LYQVVENKYVFSARLEAFCDKYFDRNVDGRLFQEVSPSVANLAEQLQSGHAPAEFQMLKIL